MPIYHGRALLGNSFLNMMQALGGAASQGYAANAGQQHQQGLLNQLVHGPQVLQDANNQALVAMGGFPQPYGEQGSPFNLQNMPQLSQLSPENLGLLNNIDLRNQPQYSIKEGQPGQFLQFQTNRQGRSLGAPQQLTTPPAKNDAYHVVKPKKMPDGTYHNIATALDPATMKEMGTYDLGETAPPGSGGMGKLVASSLDPTTLEMNYQQWKTDGQVPRIPGMGGAIATVEMMKYNAKRAKEEGLTGQAVAAQRAVYSTAKTGLSAVTKMSDTMAPAANAAKGYLDLVQKQLDTNYQPPTGSPLANEFAQFMHGEKLTGDPNYQRYKNLIYAAVRDYSKVTTGSAGSVQGLSDFATKGAEGILNVMQTPEAARSAMQAMRDDMDTIQSAWKDQKTHLRSAMQGQAQTKTQQSGGELKTKSDQELMDMLSGK